MGLLSAFRDGNSQAQDRARPGIAMRACALAADLCWGACRNGLRLCLAAVMLALVAAGAVTLALRSGPIEVPALAALVADEVNAGQGELRLSIGTGLIALTRRAGEPALRFRDVELRSAEGDLLLAVPEMGARFSLARLIAGEVRVSRLFLRGPTAEIVREPDGRWRLGLGTGMTLSQGTVDPASGPDEPVPEAAGGEADGERRAERGFAVAGALLDGLAGGDAALAELELLSALTIRDARLTYRNAATGESWVTDGATLRARRDGDGMTAVLGVELAEKAASPLRTVRVALRRTRGIEGTEIDLSLHGVRPARLADGVPELDWLALIDAPVDAILGGRLADDGRLGVVSGTLYAGEGGFVGTDGARLGPAGFDALKMAVTYEPATERLALSEMAVSGDAGSVELAGFVDVERDDADRLLGMAGQLGIARLDLDLPEHFAAPLSFDGGELVARVGFEPVTVEIAAARLDQGAFTLEAAGRLLRGAEGWQADMRAEGRNLTVAGLKAHWPLPFAPNARSWVAEHLQSGAIDMLVAQFRSGPGTPQVSLDFSYRDLVSRYLGDMPPIRNAAGRGFLRLDEFMLEMDEGHVTPVEGADVALDGSRLRISDLWGPRTPAEIDLRGTGELGAILGLIDREPLGLVSKLGLDPAAIEGEATVGTRLGFPLLKDLLLEDVEADAEARIEALEMALQTGAGEPVAVAGQSVRLTASTREMTVSGDVTADGVPLTVDWREIYGATPERREIVAQGRATPGLLARFGAALPGFEAGAAEILARLSQEGAAPPALSVSADLAEARLALPELGWSKAAGVPATIEAQARLGRSGGAEITAFGLDAPGLAAQGTLMVGPSGEVERAAVSRVVLDERADLGIVYSRLGARGIAATVRGRRLDLSLLDDVLGDADGAADGAATAEAAPPGLPAPLAVEFDIEDLALTPKLGIRSARGRADRGEDGMVKVALAGALNGEAPVDASLLLPAEGAGTLELAAPDAGAFLRATGISETARDGRLTLAAKLHDGGLDQLDGTVRMSDITLRDAPTFEGILNKGGITQVMAGGLAFSNVQMPFAYEAGVITLGTTIATGPALAVKLDGTIDEETGALDLAGVISPAYALTGVLDNIPLLGALLSGGKGEGILAMTFAVGGTIEEPSYTVNPLSLLTPGILRRIFTSKARQPDERFLEGLERDE